VLGHAGLHFRPCVAILARVPAGDAAFVAARLDGAPLRSLVAPDHFSGRLLRRLFLRRSRWLRRGFMQRPDRGRLDWRFRCRRRLYPLLGFRLGLGRLRFDRWGRGLGCRLLCFLALPLLLLFGCRVRGLARNQLGLLAGFFLPQRSLLRIDGGSRFGDRFGNRRRFSLDEHALFAHLDLNRARFACAVGFLDLRGLAAHQGDLILRFLGSVHAPEIFEQLSLVLLGEQRILDQLLAHARGLQLLEQQRRGNTKLLRKLGDVGLCHLSASQATIQSYAPISRAPTQTRVPEPP